MTVSTPKVSVIIATYCSGEGLQRVIDSLDTQTLPQDEFETIFVDDGSPDDTYAALQKLASTRANMKVLRIENSGWPSRPRNVGMQHATGEYLFFMDHDDSLYPDGLRRAHEFAVETDADIVSTKESKTNDSWWGMSTLKQGNLTNAIGHGGLFTMVPLVPHKLYRRTMVEANEIRFPEGSRVLWEDQYFNIAAYRVAQRVAILADSPTYLWHASTTNSSHTFDPARKDFWDRLDDLLRFINVNLSDPALQADRDVLLAHHMRSRVIDRLVRDLVMKGFTLGSLDVTLRARRQQSRYMSDQVFALLPKKHQAAALLLRRANVPQLRALHRADLDARASARATEVAWHDRCLRIVVDTRWVPKSPAKPVLRRTAQGRVERVLSPELTRGLPRELTDVTDDADDLQLSVVLRGRTSYVSWDVPVDDPASEFTGDDDSLTLAQRGVLHVDLDKAQLGAPLAPDVWDLRTRFDWLGMSRKGGLLTVTPTLPALIDSRPAIVYANSKGELTIDMTQHLRCLATDAEPRLGPIGEAGAIRMELQNLHIVGESRLDDTRVALARLDEDLGEQGVVLTLDDARVAPIEGHVQAGADGGQVLGAVRQQLEAGGYALLANRENAWRSTRYCVEVSADGSLELRLAQVAPTEALPTATTVG